MGLRVGLPGDLKSNNKKKKVGGLKIREETDGDAKATCEDGTASANSTLKQPGGENKPKRAATFAEDDSSSSSEAHGINSMESAVIDQHSEDEDREIYELLTVWKPRDDVVDTTTLK